MAELRRAATAAEIGPADDAGVAGSGAADRPSRGPRTNQPGGSEASSATRASSGSSPGTDLRVRSDQPFHHAASGHPLVEGPATGPARRDACHRSASLRDAHSSDRPLATGL